MVSVSPVDLVPVVEEQLVESLLVKGVLPRVVRVFNRVGGSV